MYVEHFLEIAIQCEVSPLEFWELTFFELQKIIDIYRNKKNEEGKEKITLAYLNAMWTIQWLGKNKPKPLNEILGEKKEKKAMSDNEMLERVKMLNAMFGGEINGN